MLTAAAISIVPQPLNPSPPAPRTTARHHAVAKQVCDGERSRLASETPCKYPPAAVTVMTGTLQAHDADVRVSVESVTRWSLMLLQHTLLDQHTQIPLHRRDRRTHLLELVSPEVSWTFSNSSACSMPSAKPRALRSPLWLPLAVGT